MDATGEGPHTSVCMRSNKLFVLCWDVKKATLRCLPIMQNLQRSSLQYLIPGRALLLCRAWRPRSLMCLRHMCQSLVVSSVAVEASLIMMFPVNLYKFVVCSPLRIVMEPLVILITPSAPENLYPRAFKAPNKRRFFKSGTCWTFVRVRTCPSNILTRMLPMLTVSHGVVSHQDRASIIRLVSIEPLPFWAHVVCAPRVK